MFDFFQDLEKTYYMYLWLILVKVNVQRYGNIDLNDTQTQRNVKISDLGWCGDFNSLYIKEVFHCLC